MTSVIPVNEPLISDEAIKNVNLALKTKWLSSSGSFVPEFENKFANFLGVKYATTLCNGTAALHIALLSLGIGKGDEVIVPAFTMGATWLAVIYTGATPVFVDCELETFNIDPNLIEAKITKRTKAIIPVHIYGHPAEMDKIMKIAKKHNLRVIEDAAEAHGAEFRDKKCGSFGDINCFSFYSNKVITTGEGGMIVTDDPKLAEKSKLFKDLHHSKKIRFIHDGVGYNYRMTNLQAAVGCGELKHINEYIKLKQHMSSFYESLLKDIPGIKLPVTKDYVKNVYWMYGILVDKEKYGISRDELRIKLKELGIETRDFFYSPSVQPVLKKYLTKKDVFPNTDFISERGMYLPSGLALTDKQMKIVATSIKKIYFDNF